jgi:hypothetical protein
MTLMQVGLDDKYRVEAKRIYLSGIQALVRLPMSQRERDRVRQIGPLAGNDPWLWPHQRGERRQIFSREGPVKGGS